MRDTYHDTCREGAVKVEGKGEVERDRQRQRDHVF